MDKEKTKQIREEFEQLESPNARLIDKQMEIATQISRYLREQDINQTELAKKADVYDSQISEILRGEGNPTLKTLVKIEEALGQEIIVAPFFYEEKMSRKGFMHLPAKKVEQFKMDMFDESISLGSFRSTSDFYGNITYVDDPQSEYEERKSLPLAS